MLAAVLGIESRLDEGERVGSAARVRVGVAGCVFIAMAGLIGLCANGPAMNLGERRRGRIWG